MVFQRAILRKKGKTKTGITKTLQFTPDKGLDSLKV